MTFVDVILYIGTFVFAITGALKARTHQMDILGASVLAFVTAYGGGTLRDLLIGIRVGWMNDPIPLVLVASAVIVVFLLLSSQPYFMNFKTTDGVKAHLLKTLHMNQSSLRDVQVAINNQVFGRLDCIAQQNATGRQRKNDRRTFQITAWPPRDSPCSARSISIQRAPPH